MSDLLLGLGAELGIYVRPIFQIDAQVVSQFNPYVMGNTYTWNTPFLTNLTAGNYLVATNTGPGGYLAAPSTAPLEQPVYGLELFSYMNQGNR